MALSLAAGATFVTALTLVLTPSLLAIVNDGRRVIVRVKIGEWMEREVVEAAAHRWVDRTG